MSCFIRLNKTDDAIDMLLNLEGVRMVHICDAPDPYSRKCIEVIYEDKEVVTLFTAEEQFKDKFQDKLLDILDKLSTKLFQVPK
jgi:hypothetical protein